jgi:hypothetical protein
MSPVYPKAPDSKTDARTEYMPSLLRGRITAMRAINMTSRLQTIKDVFICVEYAKLFRAHCTTGIRQVERLKKNMT